MGWNITIIVGAIVGWLASNFMGKSGGLVSNILMFIMMFYPLKWVAKIVKIPKMRVYPIVMLMCVVGAYATMELDDIFY